MITDDRWQRVEAVFHEALERPPEDRQTFVAAMCGGDAELLREVTSLLSAETSAGPTLETLVQGSAAAWLTASGGRGAAMRAARDAAVADPPDLAGVELGRYRIVDRIGHGGMGTVYRAEDTSLGRMVALKILRSEYLADPDRRRRFEDEARSASALNHPNIIVIHEIGRTSELDFIAAELIEGDTLRARLDAGPIPVAEILAIGIQVAHGLAAAHRAGIVHRDIKPANLMVRRDGVVKIVDFGIAKLAEPAADGRRPETRTGVVLGTVCYMSPEQALGETVDHRTDLFALGVVLYEMAAGTLPFDGPSDAAIYDALLHRAPPPVSRARPTLPADLDRVLFRALDKDRELRYQSASDLASELTRLQRASSEHPIPPAEVPLEPAAPRRRPAVGAWAIAVVSSALLVASLVWGAGSRGRGGSVEAPARRFEIVLPLVTEPEQIEGSPVVISPAGDRIVYARTQAATRQLYVRDLGALDERPLEGTDFAQTPFFSPDGQRVGFFARGELRTIRLNGGPPSVVGEFLGQRGAAFLDAGTIVVSSGDRLLRVSLDGGRVETIADPRPELDERSYQWPDVLPDGRTILFTVVRSAPDRPQGLADIHAMRVGTADRHVVLRDAAFARYAASGHLLFYRSGTLEAVRFDWTRVEASGAPVVVAGNVAAMPSPIQREVSSSFSISTDGTLVYIPGGTEQIFRTAVSVSRAGVAEPIGEDVRGLIDPNVSPDGRTLAIIHHAELWLVDLERGTRRKLLGGESVRMGPVWSPDGRRLVYTRWDRDGTMAIYSTPTADPERETLVWKSDGPSIFPMSFTSDGRALACMLTQGPGRFDIWVVQMGDRPVARPLLATAASEQHPQFSPDGRWLAYSSDESGRYEIYVQPYPDGGGKWPVSIDGGVEPRWSSSGRELFYRRGDAMMAVPIATGPTFAAGTPRQLFTGNYQDAGVVIDYAVVPGANRFVMIRRTEAEPVFTHLQVMLNAFSELRRLTSAAK